MARLRDNVTMALTGNQFKPYLAYGMVPYLVTLTDL